MRLLLVGTDLAPVHPDGGALELLLCGWAGRLAVDHEVWVASVPGAPEDAWAGKGGPGGEAAAAVRTATFAEPADLAVILERVAPDAVLANNRPGWQRHLRTAPVLHLLHNWPDAWALPDGPLPDPGPGAVAAVSRALADEAGRAFGREASVVDPWVDPGLLEVVPAPEAGTVLFPNRLMVKKGVAELCAAAAAPELDGCRVLVPDHLSPWTSPTAEHLALRELVRGTPHCELIPPARTRPAMAALYARADVAACPSVRPEGLGLSALEAQAAGVPVVSSGLGGLGQATLRPELVVGPTDPAALAGALRTAMGLGPTERQELRDQVAARYGLDASTAGLERVLRRVAG